MSIPILDKDGNVQKLYTQEEVDNLLKNNQSGSSDIKVLFHYQSCIKQSGSVVVGVDYTYLDAVFGEPIFKNYGGRLVTSYTIQIPGEPTQSAEREKGKLVSSITFSMNVTKPAYITYGEAYVSGGTAGGCHDRLLIVSLNYIDV